MVGAASDGAALPSTTTTSATTEAAAQRLPLAVNCSFRWLQFGNDRWKSIWWFAVQLLARFEPAELRPTCERMIGAELLCWPGKGGGGWLVGYVLLA